MPGYKFCVGDHVNIRGSDSPIGVIEYIEFSDGQYKADVRWGVQDGKTYKTSYIFDDLQPVAHSIIGGEVAKIPQPGDLFELKDLEEFVEKVEARRELFKDEPLGVTLGVLFFNFGDKYTPVACIAGEWSGLKKDIPPGTGVPHCPNGHVMTEGKGLRLGWVRAE